MISKIKAMLQQRKDESVLYDSIYKEEYAKERHEAIIEKAKADAKENAKPKSIIQTIDKIVNSANKMPRPKRQRKSKPMKVRIKTIKIRDVRPKKESVFGKPVWEQD